MDHVRVTYPIDSKLNHDCDKIHIESYTMEEVMLPSTQREKPHKAIRIVVYGRNFRAVAQPLFVMAGKTQVNFLRIAPDEKSVEGILLETPEDGSYVDVILGDQDHARHPKPFNKEMIRQIK